MTEQPATELEVLPAEARRGVAWWRSNPMLPASYRRKDGSIDLEGMERAAWLLVRLGIPVVEALGDTFVIKDQVGFKADLQRAILTQPYSGYDFDVLELDDEHATVQVTTPTGRKPPLTKRITDTDIRAYAERNETNYGEKPARMLLARATTLAIDTYAKGVIRGWVTQAGFSYADTDDLDQPAPALARPPRSVAPDGSTIPEPDREPAVDDAVRAELVARLEALDESTKAGLRETCRALCLPNVKGYRFTRAHGALLDRLIDEALEPTETVPDDLHDAAPESCGYGEESQPPRYEPHDDPGRPY